MCCPRSNNSRIEFGAFRSGTTSASRRIALQAGGAICAGAGGSLGSYFV